MHGFVVLRATKGRDCFGAKILYDVIFTNESTVRCF